MKKSLLSVLIVSWLWACVTFKPQPPSFYVEDIPPSITMGMSLEERIAVEDFWKSLQTGDRVRAQKQIAKLGSGSPVYYVGLGFLRFQEDDYQAAEESFREALKHDPDIILAYLGLAQIDQIRGLDDEVYTQYREILKREPDHPWAKPRYEALRNKRIEELMAEARRFVAAGDWENGKKALFKALFYSPESPAAHLGLARIFRKEKNDDSAVLHYKAASAGEPDNKAILKEYAETLYEAGQFGRSLDIYRLLAEQEPRNKNFKDRVESLKNKLGIYELPSLYNTIPASQAITREDLAALIAVKFKGVLNETEVRPPILIDISTSWAAKFILKITALKILDVFENHTFLPKKIVNRAELAETLLRLIDYLMTEGYQFTMQMSPDEVRLSDVPPDNYYYEPITRIIAYQIMDLSPQMTFQPDAVVGGAEASRILDVVLAFIK